MADDALPGELFALLRDARTATLATIRPDGRPRLVPMCFVVSLAPEAARYRLVAHSALDEKPKYLDDPRHLARVRDIVARPRVELLVDRWDEDWRRLAWIRLDGTARLLEPVERPTEWSAAVEALRAKYEQYRTQQLDGRPLLRIEVERASWWTPETGPEPTA